MPFAPIRAIRDRTGFFSRSGPVVTLPDDGFIPIGSLPVAIEDSPLLESVRDTPEFAEFRNELARRRAIMKRRVQAMREQLGLAAE